MPEFQMPVADSRDWSKLSPFVQGFIEAAFFCETSCFCMAEWFQPETQHAIAEGQSDGNIPNDCDTSHIHADSLKKIAEFCATFQASAVELLSRAYARDYDETQAGRDFYFTHCGAGVGYWDREVLEPQGDEWEATEIPLDQWTPELRATRERLKAESIGELLSKAAGRGEVSPFFGDHVTYGNAPFVHFSVY
ncbi:hypothetical protein [Mesorhizobium sp.]|uniref:hypothetical protein n=2 Tax=Mesorhizobium sp. TaxID=1871066 RepID=UPI000FE601DE|nr:hypothetical protein [Mesorhizobium sp.]RWP29513.1 MAG: hypothetical protein EOR03_26670 [Mesorhizobium sp.]